MTGKVEITSRRVVPVWVEQFGPNVTYGMAVGIWIPRYEITC